MSLFDKTKEKMAEYKMRILAVTAVTLATVVGYAHAAVNFTPITELISAVTTLIPGLMELVIALAPLIVTLAVIGFLVTFFRKNILEMLNF